MHVLAVAYWGGVTPCELMFGRHMRTKLDLLRPEVAVPVHENQHRQKVHHDQHGCFQDLVGEQQVWACNWGHGPQWVPAHVQDRLGPSNI